MSQLTASQIPTLIQEAQPIIYNTSKNWNGTSLTFLKTQSFHVHSGGRCYTHLGLVHNVVR